MTWGMSLKGLQLLWRIYGHPPGCLLMASSFRALGHRLRCEAEDVIVLLMALAKTTL